MSTKEHLKVAFILRSIFSCLMLICVFGLEAFGQSGNLEEVMRYKGIWGYFAASTVRATHHGVAIALTLHDTSGARLRYRSTVIAFTERGIDTVPLDNRRCSQAVVWRDTVFAALYSSRDTVFTAAALVDGGQRNYVTPGSWNLATSIQCLDGSLSIFDASRGITLYLSQNDAPQIIYDDSRHQDAFSLGGDVYYFPVPGTPRCRFLGTKSSIELDTVVKDSNHKSLCHNVTVIDDSVVWIDVKSRRWALSMSTRNHQVTQSRKLKERTYGGCAGRWGYLYVSQFESNPYNDTEIANQFVVQYSHGDTNFLVDTVRIPNIHRSGIGVGWWNGAFYFTAEVRDSGAPYETAESIIYKYTEPIPVVSVEDQLSTRTYSQLAERLAFTQDAYANWKDGLGADVTVYDLFGNEVRGFVVPHMGVYCVRGLGKVWLVTVTP